ncbi:MAG: flagellin, partial [Burkholderiaceae bacterium]
MPAVIYTNQASLMAQKGLLGAQNSLANSVERLSSGLRINRAKDDAAGLGVGENLQKQLNGAQQGLHNVNDAISMAQTAEGALQTVTSVAQRIITLATQGANDTMSQDQRSAIVFEIDKLRTTIQDIAKRTKYTDTPLF